MQAVYLSSTVISMSMDTSASAYAQIPKYF